MLLLGLAACSVVPVSALIRSPIDSKCRSYGLKGCPELVDGAIAYAQGDKPIAIQKLTEARALNTPEQLKQFAGALRTIGEATPDAGQPLVEVAALLTGEGSASVDASPPSAAPAPQEERSAPPTPSKSEAEEQRPNVDQLAALYALTARNDPMRLVTETVVTAESPGVECQIAGMPALCVRRKQGPVVVTDLVASDECGARILLAAADSDTPSFGFLWVLPARTPGIHGGQFAVGGGQWLFVGVKPTTGKPQPSDRACFVTWSGFRPRLVPGPIKDPGF